MPRPRHILTTAIASLLAVVARAGVVTDGKVGAAGAVAKAGNDFQILHTLGRKEGRNLFHSFSEFNIGSGERAVFSGPADVRNVIGRVTAGGASLINGGIVSDIDGASLFLMNPNGITFGPGASIDVKGAFTATSASHVLLSDGGRFDAANPDADVLTVGEVAAFGFLGAEGPIKVQNVNLTANPGRTLSLIGAGVNPANETKLAGVVFDSGNVTVEGGRLEVASAKGAGKIPANLTRLTRAESITARGDITADKSTLRMSGAKGGAVVIRGGRMTLTQAQIVSDTTGAGVGDGIDIQIAGAVGARLNSRVLTQSSGGGRAGDVKVRAGTMRVDGALIGSQSSSTSAAGARAGAVSVTAGKILLTNEGEIASSTFGAGSAGNVSVRAGELVVSGLREDGAAATGVLSNTAKNTTGNGGNVSVEAGKIALYNGGVISATTKGGGNGGDVRVRANEINMTGDETGIFADTFIDDGDAASIANSTGSGGDLRVDVGRLSISNGALISTKTVTPGDAGNTVVNAKSITISRGKSGFHTGIAADAPVSAQGTVGSGRGGNVLVRAETITMDSGAQISASTTDPSSAISFGNLFGVDPSVLSFTGVGGDVSVHAKTIVMRGQTANTTFIGSETYSLKKNAPGGRVEVVADTLRITDNARISATTFSANNGGSVNVRVNDAAFASNNGAFAGILVASVSTTQKGKGGSVNAEFGTLKISGTGGIAGDTLGPGAGGDVFVSAKSVSLLDGGRISAATAGTGLGGSVRLEAGELFISGAGGIFSGSTATGPGGDGGRVEIEADEMLLSNGGKIAATSSSTGAGGSVKVRAHRLALDTGATIEASATGPGVAGSVEISVDEPFTLNSGASVRTTSAISSAGRVSIESQTAIFLNDSSVTVKASKGDAGSIELLAPDRIALTNSEVLAEAGLNGGSVFIDPRFVILDNSRISANAILGAGGAITIIADSFLSSESAVTASSEASVQGTVDIQSPDAQLANALTPLSASFVGIETRLQERCAMRLGGEYSTFLVVGRGGVAPAPDEAAAAMPRMRLKGE